MIDSALSVVFFCQTIIKTIITLDMIGSALPVVFFCQTIIKLEMNVIASHVCVCVLFLLLFLIRRRVIWIYVMSCARPASCHA